MIEKLQEQLNKDLALLSALKGSHIIHPLCKTEKGELALLLRKGAKSYELTLDSIPFTQEESTFILPHIGHLIQ